MPPQSTRKFLAHFPPKDLPESEYARWDFERACRAIGISDKDRELLSNLVKADLFRFYGLHGYEYVKRLERLARVLWPETEEPGK